MTRTHQLGRDAVHDWSGDDALEEALARISDLAGRLWAVRQAHRPVTVGWRRTLRCAGCGLSAPCPTLRAAG